MDVEAIKLGLLIWAAITTSILVGVILGLLLGHWLTDKPKGHKEH